MVSREELLELYEALRVQYESIIQKIAEYEIIKDSLKEIKKEENTYVNIGGMIFVKADIKDVDNLLVNIGDNIFIEKSRDEVIQLLEKTINDLENTKTEIQKEINEIKEKLKSNL